MATSDPFDIRPAELGAELWRVRLPFRHPDMDMVGKVAPQIAFDGGFEVVESIDRIAGGVILTVSKFFVLSVTH